MLTINNLKAGYGRVQILHSLSIAVPQNSITALIGANGAGKTTLMRTILGSIRTTSGSVIFNGQAIEGLPAFERIRLGLALSPEGRMVFPGMTVAENLRLGGISKGKNSNERHETERVLTLFPRLKERLSQMAGSLSGGEQQMLALGRALMSSPRLLLLDEPTLGLAPLMADQIFECMQSLRRDGLTILVAEQNTRRTLEIADHAYVVENGRVAQQGSGALLIDDPNVRKAFLGI